MQRIHFTAPDLLRTRLRSTLGRLSEGVFALSALARSRNPALAAWRGGTLRRLREADPAHRALEPLLTSLRTPDDLLFLLDSALAAPASDSLAGAQGLDRTEATRLAVDTWRAGVAPVWGPMLARLNDECDARGRLALAQGVEGLLSGLHPGIVWRAPVLEIRDGPDRDVFLEGRGLLLCPSALLAGAQGRVLEAPRDGARPALVFALPSEVDALFALPGRPGGQAGGAADGEQALGSLVGQTRAAALRTLTDACTTSQLAERLGVSLASASQHASVLRDSGLVTTRRIRKSALHALTPLGLALLGGRFQQRGAARKERRSAA